MPVAARTPGRVTPVSDFPAPEPRKLLSGRIVALGAIPIAVFCGVYVLARQLLGSDNITAQAWTISLSLLGSIASVFLLSRLIARTIVDEVEALRDGVRAIVQGGEAPDIPTLTPPLEFRTLPGALRVRLAPSVVAPAAAGWRPGVRETVRTLLRIIANRPAIRR